MSDLEDLASMARSNLSKRRAPQKGMPPWIIAVACIFGVVIAAGFLRVMREPPGDPPKRTVDDPGVLSMQEFVGTWKPDEFHDLPATAEHGAWQELDFQMVNLRVMFVKAPDIDGNPWVISEAFDSTTNRELSGDETANRLDELGRRIAAANALVKLSESPQAMEFLRKSVHVNGYYRKNGTHVNGYDRR